ncbi:related to transcription initiation factor TFIIF subunit [Rhynchosporium agropyri]|uniref:Transcription initiation factor IIF subunit beta n=2 Tax=Rhynchosporium TaxID=38037 RepID=A0A1E1M980_RHYSE|nr:related to transcription initiation factor TFIIF subunit [Rhynchosporium agropyri]CZT45657.1 related to transcription initiation factor TFIIF subunit [Rhynchosporium secalis]
MEDVKVKPDPENAASPSGLSEEDIYEDAGDLEFNPSPDFQKLYLARVPKYIWEAWSHLDDDAEIPLGTIRQSVDPDGKMRLQMLLTPALAEHQNIPKEYDLDITDETVKNTYVFTEKDLPGFKSRSRAKFDLASANMPSRLTRPKNDKPFSKQPYDPNKRFQPYFRKAIPKRTTLAGKVAHEINCIAVDNKESQHLLAVRTLEAMRPKLHTKFVKEDLAMLGPGFIQPGTIHAQNSFNDFIKTKNQTTKERPQMMKTARMPQNELLDRIFDCFRKYNYWSMKALRAELQQPEAYLRETLEKVAVLAKSGRFATQWSLKAENRISNYAGEGDAVAPTAEDMGGEDSDMADEEDGEEDEDVKFEDV